MPRLSIATIRITPIVAVLSALLRAHPAHAAPAKNDDVADALEITALPFSDQLKTNSASSEPDLPGCAGDDSHSVWFQYTPLANEIVHADTFGSDYDTTLSVFTDVSGSLNLLDCNDDFFQLQSSLDFEATAGTTYYFRVASYEDKGGNLSFNVRNDPPPLAIAVEVSLDQFIDASGLVTIAGIVSCTVDAQFEVFASVTQKRKGVLSTADSESLFFVCVDGGASFELPPFAGDPGPFVPGTASAVVTARADTLDETAITTVEQKIVLLGP